MQNFVCKLKPGDIIVAGTDGLFDNVFSHRTTKLVWDAKKHGALPGVAAQQLATFASARSMDPVYLSPFAKAAAQAGFFYRGGKVDDITVVVSYVTAAKSSGPEAAGGDAQGGMPLEVKSEGTSSSLSGGSVTSPEGPTTASSAGAKPEVAADPPQAAAARQVGDQSATPAEVLAQAAGQAQAAPAAEPAADAGNESQARPSGGAASRGGVAPGSVSASAMPGGVPRSTAVPLGAQFQVPNMSQRAKL